MSESIHAVPRWNLYDADWRREDIPEWTRSHITDEQFETLKPVTLWRELLGRSGLPGTSRAVGLWLSMWVSDGPQGKRTHCWPRVSQIVRRSGFKERAVRDALRQLECAGWLLVFRNRERCLPSDYYLSVPDLDICPCEDCAPVHWMTRRHLSVPDTA